MYPKFFPPPHLKLAYILMRELLAYWIWFLSSQVMYQVSIGMEVTNEVYSLSCKLEVLLLKVGTLESAHPASTTLQFSSTAGYKHL